jgi:hypothetical protein
MSDIVKLEAGLNSSGGLATLKQALASTKPPDAVVSPTVLTACKANTYHCPYDLARINT